MEFERFFMEEVPSSLKKLSSEVHPKWGQMSAAEMLDHLRVAIKMSLDNKEGQVNTPENKLPAYRHFLMSDRPFQQNLEAPSYFKKHQTEGETDLDDLKVSLLKKLVEMQTRFEKEPGHTAVHPSFGKLNVEEWKQLHRKHIRHHFNQFGLS